MAKISKKISNPATKKKKTKSKELIKLANRIRSIRMAKGYTNYETFAFAHKIPRAQYGRYENGEDLRYSSLMKVLKAFKMKPADFFKEGFE